MTTDAFYLEAIPSNGDLIHAVLVHGEINWKYPDAHSKDPSSWLGRLVWGAAACGLQGRDSWAGGGMQIVLGAGGQLTQFDPENPLPSKKGYDGRTINATCPRCVGRVRKFIRIHSK